MTDPFAPATARFPTDRLQRAGVNQDDIEDFREAFDAANDAAKRRLVLLVASVSDTDLVNEGGEPSDVLMSWFTAGSADASRKLTDQEKAQAGSTPTDGGLFDPTADGNTCPKVEEYLSRVPDTAEVDRVEALELARTDRDPRDCVADAVEAARERIAAGGI